MHATSVVRTHACTSSKGLTTKLRMAPALRLSESELFEIMPEIAPRKRALKRSHASIASIRYASLLSPLQSTTEDRKSGDGLSTAAPVTPAKARRRPSSTSSTSSTSRDSKLEGWEDDLDEDDSQIADTPPSRQFGDAAAGSIARRRIASSMASDSRSDEVVAETQLTHRPTGPVPPSTWHMTWTTVSSKATQSAKPAAAVAYPDDQSVRDPGSGADGGTSQASVVPATADAVTSSESQLDRSSVDSFDSQRTILDTQ